LKSLAEGGLTGPDALEIAELHEQLQSALALGEYPQVRRMAEQLLKRKPDFAPALNNLAMAYNMEGKLAQAIATERRVLEFEPGNTDAASSWLQMWADIDPDNPEIARRQQKIAGGGRLQRLFGRRK
jgi:tetratricopeptide (TPR) repeat protein